MLNVTQSDPASTRGVLATASVGANTETRILTPAQGQQSAVFFGISDLLSYSWATVHFLLASRTLREDLRAGGVSRV